MIRLTREISPKQLEWRNDSKVMKWCRQNDILGAKHQESWLEYIHEDKSIEMFGIEVCGKSSIAGMKKKPVIVGTCGLTSLTKEHGTAEYSILVGPEYQGKGYAKAGMALLLDYGFWLRGLHLIWGEIFDTNAVGLSIAKGLGFKEDGRLRERYWKHGQRISTVIVSLTRDEWQKSH